MNKKQRKKFQKYSNSMALEPVNPYQILQKLRNKKQNNFLFKEVQDLLSSCLAFLSTRTGNLSAFRRSYVSSYGYVSKKLSKEDFLGVYYPELESTLTSFKTIVQSLKLANKSQVDLVAVKLELCCLCKEMQNLFADLYFWSPGALPAEWTIFPRVNHFLTSLEAVELELQLAYSLDKLDAVADSLEFLIQEFEQNGLISE